MDYNTAKRKLEHLVAGMKRDLKKYAAEKDASQGAIFKKAELINTVINFYNAAEEKINMHEGRLFDQDLEANAMQQDPYLRDVDFERAVLAYWDLDHRHTQQVVLINQCCNMLHKNGQLDWFKTQFKYYTEYKNLTGFKHKFYGFLGTADQHFVNGQWNAENWETKLEWRMKESEGAETKKGAAAVIEAFEKVKMND